MGGSAPRPTFSRNAAYGVLPAVDHPDVANGNAYVIAGDESHTVRQLIETIAHIMDRPIELVDMPYDAATPCHSLWQHDRNNRLVSVDKAKHELGYADQVGEFAALEQTVRWLVEHSLTPELEEQLGDPFDYDREDSLTGTVMTFSDSGAHVSQILD
jgi:nucleoside-diphosphate-sugar epimerase